MFTDKVFDTITQQIFDKTCILLIIKTLKKTQGILVCVMLMFKNSCLLNSYKNFTEYNIYNKCHWEGRKEAATNSR